MKLFIRKAIIYILLLIVLAIGLDWIITCGLRKVDDFIYQPWTYIQEGDHNHDVLILGNSRAQGHIHPAILDSICACNSYNLGIEAYHMNMHLLKYDYYLQYNQKPNLIIYQVDVATIRNGMIKRGANSEQFLPLFYESYWRDEFLNLGYNTWDMYVPLYRYFGYHRTIRIGIMEGMGIKHYNLNSSYKGFYGWNIVMQFHHEPDSLIQASESVGYSTDTDDFIVFESFIKDCKENDIKVILVQSPMLPTAEQYSLARKKFDNYIQNISCEFGVSYLDYTIDQDFCTNISYFSNPSHLNLFGAKVFTTKLAHDIDSLGLLN